MQENLNQRFCLSGNALKIIAAALMLIDHVGLILLPKITLLRIIGRLSYPIFAFMIAEGCAHTKNRLNYFLNIFVLGIVCQIALNIFDSGAKMSVLISFSVAILTVYSLQYMKNTVFSAKSNKVKKCFSLLVFILTVLSVYLLNKALRIDYGFWGCMAPLFASVFKTPANCNLKFFKKLDNLFLQLIAFGICLVLISLKYGSLQSYCILSLLILMLYSGKRGKYKMKYFFYLFYPLHLVILQGIALILKL